ncbi:chorismate mutase [Chloroflexota bacterium]
MWCRGVRGATTADSNTREAILEATKELLQSMVAANGIEVDDIACVMLTTSSDLNAEFPAVAARELGWSQVALLCGHEMDVPGSLKSCLRILLLFNTEKSAKEIVHVYVNGATELRPSSSNKG